MHTSWGALVLTATGILFNTFTYAQAPGAIPTLTVASASDYFPTGTQAPALSATLTGSDVLVQEDSSGALYVYLGPDVQSSVGDAITKSCSKTDSGCEDAIAAVFQNKDVDLQSRNPILIGAVLFAVVGIIIEQYRLSQTEVPSVVRIDKSQYAPISSVEAANPTGIAIDAGSTVNTVTMAAPVTTATGSVGTVSTLTASVSGHGKGDVVITIPDDLAARIQEILARGNTCPASSKRAVDLSCAVGGAQNLLQNGQPDYGVHDLLLLQGQFPAFQAADVVNAANQVVTFARGIADSLAITPEAAAAAGAVAFALAWYQLINGSQVSGQNYFAASDLASGTISGTPTTSTSSGCPTTPIICQDDECSGDVTTKTCSVSSNSGCKCANEHTQPPGQAYDTSSGDAQASILNSLVTALATSAKPTPSCFANSDAPNFTGGAAADPATWCVCTQTADPFASVSYSTGIYSTITSKTGSDACAYTSMPSSTITVSHQSAGTGTPSTCRIETTTYTSIASGVDLSTGVPYSSCTCDNGEAAGVMTTSLGTQTSYYCPDKTPTLTQSSTSTSVAPTPTASVLLIWDTPPVSGPVFYDIYNAPAGFDQSLDNDCGNAVGLPLSPIAEPTDPKQGNVDSSRPDTMTRQAPGDLDMGSGCTYTENTIGQGSFKCSNGKGPFDCAPPSSDLAGKIEPNNGQCGGKDTRTLVMVCPFW